MLFIGTKEKLEVIPFDQARPDFYVEAIDGEFKAQGFYKGNQHQLYLEICSKLKLKSRQRFGLSNAF